MLGIVPCHHTCITQYLTPLEICRSFFLTCKVSKKKREEIINGFLIAKGIKLKINQELSAMNMSIFFSYGKDGAFLKRKINECCFLDREQKLKLISHICGDNDYTELYGIFYRKYWKGEAIERKRIKKEVCDYLFGRMKNIKKITALSHVIKLESNRILFSTKLNGKNFKNTILLLRDGTLIFLRDNILQSEGIFFMLDTKFATNTILNLSC